MLSSHDTRLKGSRARTLLAVSLGFAIVQLDVTVVNVALNEISASYGGAVSTGQWVVSGYTIALAALILTAGALGDRIGAKRIFMAGFATFTVASLGCALAPTGLLLVAARVLQGVGAAALLPTSLALLNHAYTDEKERARAVAIWAAGASFALTAGPFVGGVLTSFLGWRSIFLVNLPVGAFGLWLSWRYTEETPCAPDRALDLPGQLLAVAALGILVAAIIEGGEIGWSNAFVPLGALLAMVTGVMFVATEARASQPMLPLSLFRHRLFSLSAASGLLVNIAFYGLIFVFSLYFQRVKGLSPLMAGLAFLPMMAACFAANLIAARTSERIGAGNAIAAGAAAMAAGCAALLGLDRDTSYLVFCLPFVALGGGLGLLVPPLTSTLLATVEKSRSGIASGVLNSVRQSGSVLGVALFGTMLSAPQGFVWGARGSLLASTLLLAAVALATWRWGRARA